MVGPNMSSKFASFIHSFGKRLATIPCRGRIMKNLRLFSVSVRNFHNENDYENIECGTQRSNHHCVGDARRMRMSIKKRASCIAKASLARFVS